MLYLSYLTTVRFKFVPFHYWKDRSNHLKKLKEIEQKLNIQQPSDWYEFQNKDVKANGGSGLLIQHGNSLSGLLTSLYPEEKWDISK
jgi:hypothetical protein